MFASFPAVCHIFVIQKSGVKTAEIIILYTRNFVTNSQNVENAPNIYTTEVQTMHIFYDLFKKNWQILDSILGNCTHSAVHTVQQQRRIRFVRYVFSKFIASQDVD